MSTQQKQLSKEEIARLKKRLAEMQNQNKGSTQGFFPFMKMTPDGICQLEDKVYARCIEFKDVNYRDCNIEEQGWR